MYKCKLCLKESDSKVCKSCLEKIDNDLVIYKTTNFISFAPLYSPVYYAVLAYKNLKLVEVGKVFANNIKKVNLPDKLIITYIPCSYKRYRKNKVDHMALIGKLLEDKDREVIKLIDRVDKLSQKDLKKDKRKLNRFKLNNINIDDRDILLIDDIITTASSINECYNLLKENYNNKIIRLALIY